MARLTHNEFLERFNEIENSDNILLMSEYETSKTLMSLRCKICGHEWEMIPSSLLRGRGCPECAKLKMRSKFAKSTDDFKKEISLLTDDEFEVIGEYVNNITPIEIKHKVCNHTFFKKPTHMKTTPKCPICEGTICIKGVNDLWTTHPEIASLLKDENDGYKYTFHSAGAKKLVWQCKNCNNNKEAIVNYIAKHGFICNCNNDNISLPNKFIARIIDNFTNDYFTEKSFDWSCGRRYDLYIQDMNLIVEMQGYQHYYDSALFGNRTLEDEISNDIFKKDTALENSIKHYIQIDCSDTSLEYMKNSIVNSELSTMFDLSSIDWNKCYKQAQTSLFDVVCNDFNNGLRICELAEKHKLSTWTIRDYLVRGTSIGMCDYTPIIGRNQSSVYC